MTDFPFACVGFDLDGTLIDSAADLAAAVNHALAVAGRAPLPVDRVRPMIGGGARTMLQRALRATGDDDRLDELLPLLTDFYEAHIADATRPFPGVVEALDMLRAYDVTLAVVTNKRERSTHRLLAEFGLADHFATVIGGDSLGGAMKPDAAPIKEMLRRCCTGGRAAYVGDSAYDVAAAKAAGIPVATFGAVAGADASFDDYADLIATLRAMATAAA